MAHARVEIANGPTHGKACCMSSKGDIQFIATNGGAIKKSVDYGITWTDVSPTMHDNPIIVGISTSYEGKYVTFAHDWDIIFTSSNYGADWVTHDISQVGIEHINYSGMSLNGQIQVVTFTNEVREEGGLLISKDYGATWTRINSNTGDEYIIAGARSLAITDDGSKIFFACESGEQGRIEKYEWNITGAPDTGIWSNLTDGDGTDLWYPYDHIAISPNGSYIIASESNSYKGIIESSDGGATWNYSFDYVPVVGITVSRDGKFRCFLSCKDDSEEYRINYSIDGGEWQYASTTSNFNYGGVACSYDAKYVTASINYELNTFNTTAAAVDAVIKGSALSAIENSLGGESFNTEPIGSYIADFNTTNPTATAAEKGALVVTMLSSIYTSSDYTDEQKEAAKFTVGQAMALITDGLPVTIDLSNLGDLTATFASKGYDILERDTDMYYNQYTEITGGGEVDNTVVYDLSTINAARNTHLHVDVGYYIKYTYNGANAVFFAKDATTLQSVTTLTEYRVKLSSDSTENNIITVGTATFKLNAFASTGLTPEGDVPCFVAGTRILTNNGYKAVEALRKTDKVVTADGRQVPFKLYTTHIKSASTSNAPFMIPAGTFGAKSPAANLIISPLHAIQSRKGVWQIPKYAAHTFEGITQINIGKSVTYYHVELPNFFKDNIVTEGTIVESFGASQVSGLKNVYKFNSKINGFTRISKPSTQAATKL